MSTKTDIINIEQTPRRAASFHRTRSGSGVRIELLERERHEGMKRERRRDEVKLETKLFRWFSWMWGVDDFDCWELRNRACGLDGE